MQALLIDLDGVLYQADEAIAGAADCVHWLQQSAVPHPFVTNTTSRPRRAICAKLAAMGISVVEDQILTPVIAAAHWLKSHDKEPAALFVPEATKTDFADVAQLDAEVEAGAASLVVGDLGEAWSFTRLNQAFRLLMDARQPSLIALGMTRYWHAADGLRLDVAPFIKALEHATGTEAIVLGKPSTAFFQQALHMLNVSAGNAVMIGDDIRGDIKGAQDAGIKAISVKTGKFRARDLQGSTTPDAILDSIKNLPQWWQQHC